MNESVWDIPCKNSNEAIMIGGCLLMVNTVLGGFGNYTCLADVKKDFEKMQRDLAKKLSLNEVGKEQLEIIENSCKEDES